MLRAGISIRPYPFHRRLGPGGHDFRVSCARSILERAESCFCVCPRIDVAGQNQRTVLAVCIDAIVGRLWPASRPVTYSGIAQHPSKSHAEHKASRFTRYRDASWEFSKDSSSDMSSS